MDPHPTALAPCEEVPAHLFAVAAANRLQAHEAAMECQLLTARHAAEADGHYMESVVSMGWNYILSRTATEFRID